jgi:hypothetical protein
MVHANSVFYIGHSCFGDKLFSVTSKFMTSDQEPLRPESFGDREWEN